MSTSDPLQEPLSFEDILSLENFLASDRLSDDSLSSVEMLDGYLAAVVVGPELVLPSVWMPGIWDAENSPDPVFVSQEEAEAVTGLLIRYMNTIARQFSEEPEAYQPVFENITYAGDGDLADAVEDWALGFLIGMELTNEVWAPIFDDEDASLLVLPMFILAGVADDLGEISPEELEDLPGRLAECVIEIFFFWKVGRR